MTKYFVPTFKYSGYCGILTLLIIFSFFSESGLAECSNCTTSVNNYSSSSPYTLNSGTKICFTGTNNLTGDISFGNNASFCVEPTANLTLGANNYNVNSTSDIFTTDVYGTLSINQTPTWRGKMFINIHKGATLNIPNTINLNCPEITFTNDGTLVANIIDLQTPGATSSTYNVRTSVAGTTYYRVYITQTGKGCEANSIAVPVIVASLPIVVITATGVSCYEGNDGKITVTASGGSGNYFFSKDDGAAYTTSAQSGSYTFKGLTENYYKIKVKDTNGCISSYIEKP